MKGLQNLYSSVRLRSAPPTFCGNFVGKRTRLRPDISLLDLRMPALDSVGVMNLAWS